MIFVPIFTAELIGMSSVQRRDTVGKTKKKKFFKILIKIFYNKGARFMNNGMMIIMKTSDD